MGLFPLPNIPGTQLNNYIRSPLITDNNDSYDGRLDWAAGPKDNLFVRYAYINRSRFIPGNYGGIADGTGSSSQGRQQLKAYSGVLGWTHIFSPNILNDFHFGYIRNLSLAQQDPFGLNAADQYVPGIPNNPATAGGVPQTQFANYTFLGSPDFLPKSQAPQQFQYLDALSISRGRHSMKFGLTLYAPMRNIFQDEPSTRGTWPSRASSPAFAGELREAASPMPTSEPPESPMLTVCLVTRNRYSFRTSTSLISDFG